MTRDEVKKIVYRYCKEQFFDNDEDFNKYVVSKSFDGEDLLYYNEICLDTLDTIYFIEDLEKEFKIKIPDELFNSMVTLRHIIDFIYKEIKK